ncbi:MAG: hypothetical protein IPL64_17265 [Flavobacteriales bacterium]|nr:hypothetical protein [Flavobacteriales bacterium]
MYAFVCLRKYSARAIEVVARLKGVVAAKGRPFNDLSDLSQLSTHARPQSITAAFRITKRGITGSFHLHFRQRATRSRSCSRTTSEQSERCRTIRIPARPLCVNRHLLVVASVHDPDLILDHTIDPERIEEHLGHQVETVIDGGLCGLERSTRST